VEKVRFNNDALARYLSMQMYAVDGKMDDARIAYNYLQRAFSEQPNIYDFPMPSVKYFPQYGDNTLLNVVALVGRSPVKEAMNLRLRTDKDLDLVQVLYTEKGRENPEYFHLVMPVSEDFYFKFSIPKIVERPSEIQKIRIRTESGYLGELQLLEDVSRVAKETFKAKKTIILVRSILRTLAKGIAAHELKQKLDTGGLLGWLKKAVVDVGTEISEGADLRCSQFLPGRIFIGDFEIPPGTYDIYVEFIGYNNSVRATKYISGFNVGKNQLNLIEAFYLN
jgi:hypothetical protein